MPKKSPHLLPSYQKKRSASWAAVGIDTSMSSIAVTGYGFDSVLDKISDVAWAEKRWIGDHYFKRLEDAVRAADMVLSVLKLWRIEPEQVYIAIEEPWYYGAVKHGDSQYLKQMAEVSGAVKGSLVKHGWNNIFELNNSQWKKVLRQEGVEFQTAPKGSTRGVKDKIALENKFLVKQWAIQAYGLPDLPDLVKNKTGTKIPRPEEGFGAKAKAIQPDDIYDAAACMAWMADSIEKGVPV